VWIGRSEWAEHIGRTKGGLNSKLHAVCDTNEGRPPSVYYGEELSSLSGSLAALCLAKRLPPQALLYFPVTQLRMR
jgi:hypothetical protein